MARKIALGLALSFSVACTAVEEASLGGLYTDAAADLGDAQDLEPLDTAADASTPPQPFDAGANTSAIPVEAMVPTADSQIADDGSIVDATMPALEPHDAALDIRDSAAPKEAGHDAHLSLECRLEPWECR